MVEWIDEAVIWLNLWLLKPTRNRFIKNPSREEQMGANVELASGISIIYLELNQVAIKLLQLTVVFIQSSLRFIGMLEISWDRIFPKKT